MRMYNVFLYKYTVFTTIYAEDAEKVYNPEFHKWYLRFYRNKEMVAEFVLDEVVGWVEKLPEQGGNNDAAC